MQPRPVHVAAYTGVEYTEFNSLVEYEQQLETLGFPALWPYVAAQDYAALHEQCQQFDRRLQTFLTEHSVRLYSFASLDELEDHLRQNRPNE